MRALGPLYGMDCASAILGPPPLVTMAVGCTGAHDGAAQAISIAAAKERVRRIVFMAVRPSFR
jgi:hypothetical protein